MRPPTRTWHDCAPRLTASVGIRSAGTTLEIIRAIGIAVPVRYYVDRRATPKQARFAVEYVRTGNASEAYRIAYDVGGMLPATIGKEAQDLVAHPLVSPLIIKERERVLAPVRASVEWIVTKAADIAESDEAPHSARVQALTLLSKRFPEFKEGIQIQNNTLNLSGLTAEQLQKLIDGDSDPSL